MSSAVDETRRYLLAGLGGLGVALAGAAVFSFFTRPPPPAPPRGPPAPDFEYPRLDGQPVQLSALRGQVVMVDFWATWCPPCREEMPMLVATAQRLGSRGVTLVAIAEDDPPRNVELVRRFAAEVPGLERYAVLGDPAVEQRYGVKSLPTLFIIDRSGHIAARFVGRAREEQILPVLESVLGR